MVKIVNIFVQISKILVNIEIADFDINLKFSSKFLRLPSKSCRIYSESQIFRYKTEKKKIQLRDC